MKYRVIITQSMARAIGHMDIEVPHEIAADPGRLEDWILDLDHRVDELALEVGNWDADYVNGEYVINDIVELDED